MDSFENYVYKAEVNWSLLIEGLTLPVDNQVIFGRNMGRFLYRGETLQNQSERVMETNFNYDIDDKNATILKNTRIVKIRKLNKKIGDNLKLLYNFQCQICGQITGTGYGTHVA